MIRTLQELEYLSKNRPGIKDFTIKMANKFGGNVTKLITAIDWLYLVARDRSERYVLDEINKEYVAK
jgi:hypothetical protein